MSARKYYVFNSFGERPFGGNPAGVVLDSEGLSAEQMQLIARQLNLVETVFVFPQPEAGVVYGLRYFTPAKELPIAGHPTIAAWACLLHTGAVSAGDGPFVQKTGAGNIRVVLKDGKIFVSQKNAIIKTLTDLPWADICAVVDLQLEDIDKNFPAAAVDAGLGHLIFCVRSLDSLMKMKFRPDELKELCRRAGVSEAQIFCFEVRAPGMDGHTRNLCPRFGLEDPACGNGCAALGAYFSHYIRKEKNSFRLAFEQGYIVNMPSVIEVLVEPDGIMVGGGAQLMQEGVIYI